LGTSAEDKQRLGVTYCFCYVNVLDDKSLITDEWSQNVINIRFHHHYQDIHRCTMKITELVPNEKVAWLVLDNYFNFTKDKTEWKGTEIVFEISQDGPKTRINFTHVGLVPEYECYKVCVDGWSTYIDDSLRELITTGKGKPNLGQAITD
jgi:hypothetical protein